MHIWGLIAAIAGIITLAVLSGWRKYPFDLGLMSAVGVSTLVFATLQTIHRLRQQARREEPGYESSAVREEDEG